MKIDCAGVPLYRVSALLNYLKSLCPLLLSLCFSIFALMHFSLKSVSVLKKVIYIGSALLQSIVSIIGGKNEIGVSSHFLNHLQRLEKLYL